MYEKKVFLGYEIDKEPHKIARELVAYMLEVNRPLSIEQLVDKLSKTNTLSNLKTRITRCLLNTPDVVNERKSEQSRIFSIALQYKNINVKEINGKYLLELTDGLSPKIRETDYTEEDLKIYMETRNKSTINVKQEFAEWLLKNAPVSYNQYLGSDTGSVIRRLDEIDAFFPERELFKTNSDGYLDLVKYILFKTNNKERINNPEFVTYDKFHSNGIPKAVIGKNNFIKFLKEKFDGVIKNELNYWIFQGNPNIYNLKSALRDGDLKTWKVAAHKDKIKPGDKVIIWQTGEQAGCYALAEVLSEVSNIEEEAFEKQHYVVANDLEITDRVELKITNSFPDNPILWSDLKNKPEFANFKAGNQGTNFSATQQEYNTIRNMATTVRFSWVKTHKDIVNYLKDKENNQKDLIKLLESAGIDPFNDQNPENQVIRLEEIDPFTFFAYIYKYGSVKRLELLQIIAEKINAFHPLDENGIPSANPQRVWLFPYKYSRTSNEIARLWKFFFHALDNTITDELFEDILKIRNVAKTKITEGLFYIMPDRYFPINGPTKPFLQEKFGINPNFNSYTDYLNILQQLRAKTNTPFYQLSHDAWHWNNQPTKEVFKEQKKSVMKPNLNQLFYGPPGTGKTYGTIAEAIKIVDNDYYELNKKNRKALTKRYQELLITDWKEANGQIAFCTFHQSFTYEDFVEGIKPKTTQNQAVYYDIEPGIFKRICELADSSKSISKVKKEGTINWTEEDFRKAFFYKLSLGDANNPEEREIYEFCRDSNFISIGFASAYDLSGKTESEIKELCEQYNEPTSAGSQLSTFIHGLSKGDYVLISKGNFYVRALGKVVGDYEFHDDLSIAHTHFRKVEWVFIDENIPIEQIYYTTLMQRTIYRIDHEKLRKDFFVKDQGKIDLSNEKIKPYVLVIDEINRGNVASIFGELITLIEPDKRAGEDEHIQVILPYSKIKFSVPDNVYIIGTMNTADRSIEALDSALRRRFNFTEIQPNPNLIDEILKEKAIWNEISLSKVLYTINKRIIALIDRDHQIGHSYFLKLKNVDSNNFGNSLKTVFTENIIPLLQEYFFKDYVKIGMVLGEGFLEKSQLSEKLFAEMEDSLEDDYNDVKDYVFVDLNSTSDDEFKIILNKLLNK